MIGVKVEITRYTDDSFPGWVECQLTDTHGRCWLFVEKVPVVTQSGLDANSPYPQPGLIACNVIGQSGDATCIDTTHPWGIESIEGETRFEVMSSSLIEL